MIHADRVVSARLDFAVVRRIFVQNELVGGHVFEVPVKVVALVGYLNQPPLRFTFQMVVMLVVFFFQVSPVYEVQPGEIDIELC